MPFYEYECPKCGEHVEKLMKINDPAPECPKDAEHGAMEKKLTGAVFKFKKGDGVYQGTNLR